MLFSNFFVVLRIWLQSDSLVDGLTKSYELTQNRNKLFPIFAIKFKKYLSYNSSIIWDIFTAYALQVSAFLKR